MNRRDLLKRAFVIGANGLLLPEVGPIRRFWPGWTAPKPSESPLTLLAFSKGDRLLLSYDPGNAFDVPVTLWAKAEDGTVHILSATFTPTRRQIALSPENLITIPA